MYESFSFTPPLWGGSCISTTTFGHDHVVRWERDAVFRLQIGREKKHNPVELITSVHYKEAQNQSYRNLKLETTKFIFTRNLLEEEVPGNISCVGKPGLSDFCPDGIDNWRLLLLSEEVRYWRGHQELAYENEEVFIIQIWLW